MELDGRDQPEKRKQGGYEGQGSPWGSMGRQEGKPHAAKVSDAGGAQEGWILAEKDLGCVVEISQEFGSVEVLGFE